MQSTCTRCHGEGSYNKNPCSECEGHGNSVQKRSCCVQIPAGIDNGQTLRTQLGKVISFTKINFFLLFFLVNCIYNC